MRRRLERALAGLRRSFSGPLLLVDATAPFLCEESSVGDGLPWQEAAARLIASPPQELLVAGCGREGLLALVAAASLPAGLEARLDAGCDAGAPRPGGSDARLALAAALQDAAAPWALFEGGTLRWATPGLWAALGLAGGRSLGSLFVHPGAPACAVALEARVAGGKAPPGMELVALQAGSALLRPADLAMALAAGRIERLAGSWGLTQAERRELEHLRHGRTSKEAAALDGVSPETNRQRRRQIFSKAGVSTAGALRAALEGLPHAARRTGGS